MARINPEVIIEGEYLFPHPGQEAFVASSGKIGSTHRTCEKGVPGKHRTGCNEAHSSWRMPGSVNNGKTVGPHLNLRSFLEASVGRDTEGRSVMGMDEERRLGDSLQFRGTSYVIDVTVGDKNGPDTDTVPRNLPHDPRDLVSGIDDDSIHGLFACQDVAIGLVSTYNQFSKHSPNLPSKKPCNDYRLPNSKNDGCRKAKAMPHPRFAGAHRVPGIKTRSEIRDNCSMNCQL